MLYRFIRELAAKIALGSVEYFAKKQEFDCIYLYALMRRIMLYIKI